VSTSLSVVEVVALFDEISTSGSAEEIPAQVEKLSLLDLSPDAELFLRVVSAQAKAHFGSSEEALSLLDLLEAEITQSQSGRDIESERMLESSLNVARGVAYCDQEMPDRALPCLRRALEIQRGRSDHWRISALHVNIAIAACLADDQKGSLASLARATDAIEQAPVPVRWKRNRLVTIEINRGGVYAMLGDLNRAINAYLSARSQLETGDDLVSLGHLDFNLSTVYRDAGRFGSALESATSAQRAYIAAGALAHARKARVAQAAALRRMRRLQQAEKLIVNECLSEDLGNLSGTELNTAIAAIGELAHIYRATDRYKESQVLEHASTRLSLQLPRPEERALGVLTRYIFDALDSVGTEQDVRAPSELEWSALDAIKRSKRRPDASIIASLFERLMRAYTSNDYEDQPLNEVEARTAESIGWDLPMWRSLVDIGVGIRRKDDHRLLRGYLLELARFHALVADQESPVVRSAMLSSRGGSAASIVVPLLLSAGDYAGLFEVIEWMRCDLGESRVPSLPHELVRFGQLLGISDDATRTYALPPPIALAVRGKSVLHGVDPKVEIVAEADEVRRELAGESAAWWTHMFFNGSLVWALLTPDGIYGGSRPLGEAASTALRNHFRALPVPLADDATVLGSEEAPWLRSVVAIARSASGPLVQSKTTLGQCFSACPESIETRLRDAFPVIDDTFDAIYSALGSWMIPHELVDYLTKYSADARILISVQPEIASVPSCLLRTPDGTSLVELATLLYAPPVRTAASISRRPYRPGFARDHLLIRNPVGDLPDSDLTFEGGRVLSGWAGAASSGEVASRDAVLRALQDENAATRPTALSYFGHIESGQFGDPASAALLVAPENPAGETSRLSARDLSVAQVAMPDRIYLGGCEGAGFATSLEWSSIGAAALTLGSDVVIAHRWPIIDGQHAGIVDRACTAIIANGGDPASQLGALQRHWCQQWRRRDPQAVPPHYWAGLQVIGRSLGQEQTGGI
jgi:tetratricopeptide (TPR) repeat protein